MGAQNVMWLEPRVWPPQTKGKELEFSIATRSRGAFGWVRVQNYREGDPHWNNSCLGEHFEKSLDSL